MAKVRMHVREVSYRIRLGKDGPQQFARIVCHVEVPDQTVKAEIDALTDDQKGSFIADLDVEQPSLPMNVGMEG
jgi:hypothetical protein